MPNGSLGKQKRPKEVINVVSNADSRARRTCQKPELASTLERMLAPASCRQQMVVGVVHAGHSG